MYGLFQIGKQSSGWKIQHLKVKWTRLMSGNRSVIHRFLWPSKPATFPMSVNCLVVSSENKDTYTHVMNVRIPIHGSKMNLVWSSKKGRSKSRILIQSLLCLKPKRGLDLSLCISIYNQIKYNWNRPFCILWFYFFAKLEMLS